MGQQQQQQQQTDYMGPANTLMTLSSRPQGTGGDGQQVAAELEWPINLYHLALPGNSGG